MTPGPTIARRPLRIWDAPTRLFHWALALLILFCWATYKTDQMGWHRMGGYAVIALLAFRLWWGVAGSQTARFSDFVRGPRAVWRYLCGRSPAPLGHNPLGGWSVVAMLMLMLAQAVLGLFSIDELGVAAGPFADAISLGDARLATRLHGLAFDGLLGLIALHIAAVLAYLAVGKNLIGPMITGRRTFAGDIQPPRFAPLWVLVGGVALAVTVFVLLERLGGT